jgi:hypothetical protein
LLRQIARGKLRGKLSVHDAGVLMKNKELIALLKEHSEDLEVILLIDSGETISTSKNIYVREYKPFQEDKMHIVIRN